MRRIIFLASVLGWAALWAACDDVPFQLPPPFDGGHDALVAVSSVDASVEIIADAAEESVPLVKWDIS
ncbi:hypothetical protein BH09MYX1_BH09MYX1_30430 [soil metagenome]